MFRSPLALRIVIVLLAAMYMPHAIVWAQTAANSGEIVGQLTDPSGAAVADAQVTLRNKNTNYTREVTTDSAGRYSAPQLPLGSYEIAVKASGFAAESQQTVVRLGSAVSVNFQLSVGPKSEVLQVRAEDVALEPTQAPSKSMLTELQIRSLPSNGGRMQNLVWEMPGSQVEPECRGLSVAGQKGIYANFNVDGGDYISTFACATGSTRGGSGSAPTFNLDAIQEFTVTRNVFTAEFGRTTGGVINVSTRSGTNDFHGDAWLLSRNQSLTAQDAFGNTALSGNQQFGGSLGGPIRKDRTFFFIAPEFQFASKPVLVTYAALDQQNLRGTPAGQALLAVAPDNVTLAAPSNAQSVISRVDHQISTNNRIFGRFDFTHTRSSSLTGSSTLQDAPSIASTTSSAASNVTNLDVWSGTVLAQLTTTLSASKLNEVRAQFGREDRPRAAQGIGPQVSVSNAGATIATYGPQGTGISFGNGQFASVDNRSQLTDNFTIIHGAHTIKLGFDELRVSSNVTFAPGSNGVYTFTSLSSYLARQPAQYLQFTGTGAVTAAIDYPGFYLQDDWRVGRTLTISPGFRYEMQFNPNYRTATLPTGRFSMATSIPSDLKMPEPRLGIAWDVQGNSKTVVKAGAGIYYAPVNSATFIQSILFNGGNPELGYQFKVTNPALLANAFQSVGVNLATAPLDNLPVFTADQATTILSNPATTPGQNVNFFDPNFVNPRALQLKIGVDREIAKSINAGIDFTDIKTVDITRQLDVNLGTPTADPTGRLIYPSSRPYGPQFGIGQATVSNAPASYRSLSTSLTINRPRYVISAYYTLGWNVTEDDTEHPVGSIIYDSAANLKNEYNWSNLDMRHQFTATGVFFLPFGFQISNTARFLSGRPFSATAGTDLNHDGQITDRPVIDGSVLNRNAFRNAAFADVDMRIQRSFAFSSEKKRISLSADFFNLLNSPNVLLGSANESWGPGETVQAGKVVVVPPPANFGKYKDSSGHYLKTNTAGDPFQVQLGIRFDF